MMIVHEMITTQGEFIAHTERIFVCAVFKNKIKSISIIMTQMGSVILSIENKWSMKSDHEVQRDIFAFLCYLRFTFE